MVRCPTRNGLWGCDMQRYRVPGFSRLFKCLLNKGDRRGSQSYAPGDSALAAGGKLNCSRERGSRRDVENWMNLGRGPLRGQALNPHFAPRQSCAMVRLQPAAPGIGDNRVNERATSC